MINWFLKTREKNKLREHASLFGIVVVVAVQSVFHLEIHQNDIFFYFLKIIFEISTSK